MIIEHRIINYLRYNPWKTSTEIAMAISAKSVSVTSLMSDMLNRGVTVKSETRRGPRNSNLYALPGVKDVNIR
jgi:hypothetical protein